MINFDCVPDGRAGKQCLTAEMNVLSVHHVLSTRNRCTGRNPPLFTHYLPVLNNTLTALTPWIVEIHWASYAGNNYYIVLPGSKY